MPVCVVFISLCFLAVSQNSGFAVEALAGLASKENFSKVELRKTDSTGASRLDPYQPLMLIHIKGKLDPHLVTSIVKPLVWFPA